MLEEDYFTAALYTFGYFRETKGGKKQPPRQNH